MFSVPPKVSLAPIPTTPQSQRCDFSPLTADIAARNMRVWLKGEVLRALNVSIPAPELPTAYQHRVDDHAVQCESRENSKSVLIMIRAHVVSGL